MIGGVYRRRWMCSRSAPSTLGKPFGKTGLDLVWRNRVAFGLEEWKCNTFTIKGNDSSEVGILTMIYNPEHKYLDHWEDQIVTYMPNVHKTAE